MTVFRIKPDNYFGDVVLAAADRDGLRIFQYAVRSAHESGQATFEFEKAELRIWNWDRKPLYGASMTRSW